MSMCRFGFCSASYLSLASSCVAQITRDQSQIGTRTGMFTAAMAPGKNFSVPSDSVFITRIKSLTSVLLGILAGPPIAGALLALRSRQSANASGGGAGDFRYLWAQFFGGSLLVVGAFFAFAARMAVSRKVRTKV